RSRLPGFRSLAARLGRTRAAAYGDRAPPTRPAELRARLDDRRALPLRLLLVAHTFDDPLRPSPRRRLVSLACAGRAHPRSLPRPLLRSRRAPLRTLRRTRADLRAAHLGRLRVGAPRRDRPTLERHRLHAGLSSTAHTDRAPGRR